MNRKIQVNMILNGIVGIFGVIFPLITFPYVSRVLDVKGMGQYNFCVSIISYFSLFANLGISTYAVRDGAKYVDKKELIHNFVSEIFTINFIATLFSYLLLGIFIVSIDRLRDNIIMICILSIPIILNTLSREWICSLYEDYVFASIRSLVTHTVSVTFLFLFVKNSDDLINYVFVSISGNVLSSIITFFRTNRFVEIRIMINRNSIKHFKKILVFFATILAVSVYVSSDITILGFITDDYHVGLYSISVKIYTIMKQIIVSSLVTTIPRLAKYKENMDFDSFNRTENEVFNFITTCSFSVLTGIFFFSTPIIELVAGQKYLKADISMKLLAIALVFSMVSYFWSQCVLNVIGRESEVLIITIAASIINIILNIIFIPYWKHNAAALTTVISEAFTAFIFFWKGREHIEFGDIKSELGKVLVGCGGIIVIIELISCFELRLIENVIITVLASVIIYLGIESVLKNTFINSIIIIHKKQNGEE